MVILIALWKVCCYSGWFDYSNPEIIYAVNTTMLSVMHRLMYMNWVVGLHNRYQCFQLPEYEQKHAGVRVKP